MRNRIIYLTKTLLFDSLFLAALLFTAFSFNTNAQDGDIDLTFDPGTGTNIGIWTTVIQSDGKIIIGGQFISYNGTSRNHIARLNDEGTLDATFDPGTGVEGINFTSVYTIALQNNGKIFIGGTFNSYNGTLRNNIALLNADGTLDNSFNPGSGTNNAVSTSAIQVDGKIIISGHFTSFNGTPRNHIARLNTDGSLDATFYSGTGTNGTVYTTTLQNDGKTIIGGDFTSFDGIPRNYIARLNADGTLDTTFNPGTGANNQVITTAIQSDGKIIIGGDFTSFDGTPRNYIARLNANGTLDATFNPGTGANDYVMTTALQSDGNIITGGYFTSFDGTQRNYIARLNTDGTLDASFNPGSGANSWVTRATIQSDGKIIICGAFTSYNEIPRNYIVRILNSNVGINIIQRNAATSIYPNPVSDEINIVMKGNNEQVDFEIFNSIGQLVFKGSLVERITLPTNHLTRGVYLIKLENDKTFEFKKIIKE
jgi:uncharacterized delta-60 repeat protein